MAKPGALRPRTASCINNREVLSGDGRWVFPPAGFGKACAGELGEHLSGLRMCTEGKDMGRGGPEVPCLQSRGPL